jgi:chromate transporter
MENLRQGQRCIQVIISAIDETKTPSTSIATPGEQGENPSVWLRLVELARLFLRLGFTAFGGPAAHIAMFEDEVVRRRKWMDAARFVDLLGATNLIPGPNSTEMVIHIGYLRAGWQGMIVAGLCFILPSTFIVLGISWVYVKFGVLPQATWLMQGIAPVVLVIVLQALIGLSRKIITGWGPALVGAGSMLLFLVPTNPLLILFGAGALVMLIKNAARLYHGPGALAILFLGKIHLQSNTARPFTLWELFLTFLKIGSILYGSGYVLLAFFQAEFVNRLGWLSEKQLLDAIAIGQITPGPVFNSAAFVGYTLGGVPGAAVATIGIFLPSFVFVALSNPIIPRIRQSLWASAFLDGINLASLGMMAGVLILLGRNTLTGPFPILVAGISALLLFRFRTNTTWLILGGAAAGWLYHWL